MSIIFKAPSAVAFSVFGFNVKFYGIMMFLAMSAGLFATYTIAKKHYKNLDLGLLVDFFPWLILVSLVFARVYYVLLSLDFYLKFPMEIFAVWHGGISIHGAILGGLIAGIVYFRIIHKKQLLPYADVVSYGLALGQSIGRWGNFFNQEAFGAPCNFPWKLYIEPAFRPTGFQDFNYFHPTFLYESLWDLFLFILLCLIFLKKRQIPSGVVFFTYLALYSLGRIIIENIRIDSVLDVFGVPIALVVSFLTLLVSVIGIILLFIEQKNTR